MVGTIAHKYRTLLLWTGLVLSATGLVISSLFAADTGTVGYLVLILQGSGLILLNGLAVLAYRADRENVSRFEASLRRRLFRPKPSGGLPH